MANLKKDGLLASHMHSAVSGHGRVVLFLNLCAVSDVQSSVFSGCCVTVYKVGLLLNVWWN